MTWRESFHALRPLRSIKEAMDWSKLGTTTLRRKQQLFKAILIGLSCLGCGILCFYVLGSEPQAKQNRQYKTHITGGSDRLNPQKAWFEQMSTQIDQMNRRLDSLENPTTERPTGSNPPGGNPTGSTPRDGNPRGGHPPEPVAGINQVNQGIEIGRIPLSSPPDGSSSDSSSSTEKKTQRSHTRGIQRMSLSSPPGKTLKTGDNTIPAGAFAEAVLLGGVDASTSIQASGDPRPVLLRITNPGTLPRRFTSDLCGCHVLAACYGDISSERVFMRLEKITCTERKTGEIIEMNVKGYVAGEDGRAGLRGVVVDRAGESVRNAAIGGFIGGMAGFMSQANQNPVTYSLSSGLSQTPGLKGSDMIRQGAAKGAGNALEKYADFYIKRAEQMQPVIQVQAGRIVDIVTTESTPLESSAERRSLIHINDRKRYEQIQLPSLSDMPTSGPTTNVAPTSGLTTNMGVNGLVPHSEGD